jgi:hypothetical protein
MTGTLTLSSTFLLTLLLSVGLIFFIRAATKDRTETLDFAVAQDPQAIAQRLQQYFRQRAYGLVQGEGLAGDRSQNHDPNDLAPGSQTWVFEGLVAPSWFMAIFLSTLAGVGFLCIALVLVISWPSGAVLWFTLPALSPLAGVFYWKKAKRLERVSLTLSPLTEQPDPGAAVPTYQVEVTGHRDELAALRQSLGLKASA